MAVSREAFEVLWLKREEHLTARVSAICQGRYKCLSAHRRRSPQLIASGCPRVHVQSTPLCLNSRKAGLSIEFRFPVMSPRSQPGELAISAFAEAGVGEFVHTCQGVWPPLPQERE